MLTSPHQTEYAALLIVLFWGFGLFCVFGTGSGSVVKITINSKRDVKQRKKNAQTKDSNETV